MFVATFVFTLQPWQPPLYRHWGLPQSNCTHMIVHIWSIVFAKNYDWSSDFFFQRVLSPPQGVNCPATREVDQFTKRVVLGNCYCNCFHLMCRVQKSTWYIFMEFVKFSYASFSTALRVFFSWKKNHNHDEYLYWQWTNPIVRLYKDLYHLNDKRFHPYGLFIH